MTYIECELDVDLLAAKFVAYLVAAANAYGTMPQVCKRTGVHSRKHQGWSNSQCKQALKQKTAEYNNLHFQKEQQ